MDARSLRPAMEIQEVGSTRRATTHHLPVGFTKAQKTLTWMPKWSEWSHPDLTERPCGLGLLPVLLACLHLSCKRCYFKTGASGICIESHRPCSLDSLTSEGIGRKSAYGEGVGAAACCEGTDLLRSFGWALHKKSNRGIWLRSKTYYGLTSQGVPPNTTTIDI